MAGLNKSLEASSLIECVVASVILLASFAITMEMLTRVTLKESDPAENVKMELSLRECRREYGDGCHVPGNYSRENDWGTLEITIRQYGCGLQHISIKALPRRGVKNVRYDYLVKEEL
ncbi:MULTISPECIES: hypothetical protein [unclassified Butyricimonas]|uniref:hypothetical protein n=1 Tax=unclassified Butyricimonas TaxID=2637652 RepID=UPI000C0807B2|nr:MULTISPECIES: hypothetical protein [unclassified Butyricimonas]